jgi:glycosyltransferase involved in cell wall biosynthesis
MSERSTAAETTPQLTWMRSFERAHGRPLRVLHIGNIANNGYNNAKIQRDHGIEADVIAYDYYHIMGTPEWEDAEINGSLGDPFYPDWWAVDLGEWQRPNWFIQGPLLECVAYLRAKVQGDKRECAIVRTRLVLAYWHLVRHHQKSEGRADGLRSPFVKRFIKQTYAIAPETSMYAARGFLPGMRRLQSLSLTEKLRSRVPKSASTLVGPRIMGLGDPQKLKTLYDYSRNRLCLGPRVRVTMDTLKVRARREPDGAIKDRDAIRLARHTTSSIAPRLAEDVSMLGYLWCRGILFLPVYAARKTARSLRSLRASARLRAIDTKRVKSTSGDVSDNRQQAVHKAYRQAFTHVEPRVLDADLRHADSLSRCFADVLDHYDVIQGYSTDGIIPLFAGVTHFAAYEHGTIREIPFQDNMQGRLCHFTYKMAPAVFVTNTDVLPSIPRIGIAPERVVHLPHAFNDAKLRAFRDGNPSLAPPPGTPIFFSPTRHHWDQGDNSWLKGNDVFLRAAGSLAKEGRTFKLILVEWGVEVARSKALIAELQFTHLVDWVPPMTKRQLWKFYCESHAVIDQFTLPAIGGVAFETLALGRRLITRIDESTLAHFFGAAPPIFNGCSVNEVSARMREILDDPEDQAGRGHLGRTWIQTYHSAERVIRLQLKAYETILTKAEPAAQMKLGSLV